MIKKHAPSCIHEVSSPVGKVAVDLNILVHSVAKSKDVYELSNTGMFAFGDAGHVSHITNLVANRCRVFQQCVLVCDSVDDMDAMKHVKRFEHARRKQSLERTQLRLDARMQQMEKLSSPSKWTTVDAASLKDVFGDVASKRMRVMSEEDAVNPDELASLLSFREAELKRSQWNLRSFTRGMVASVASLLEKRHAFEVRYARHCDAEKLCVQLQLRNECDYVWSDDMDTLPYGCTKLLCKNTNASFVMIDRQELLTQLGLTQEQFVDFCILCGTDFTETTIFGLGGEGALKKMRAHGSIEEVVQSMRTTNKEDVDTQCTQLKSKKSTRMQASLQTFNYEDARMQFLSETTQEDHEQLPHSAVPS